MRIRDMSVREIRVKGMSGSERDESEGEEGE